MLDAGLVSLGWSLPDSVRAAIDSHVRLLLAWSRAINLTSIREPEAVARLHVLDSLAATAVLRDLGAERFLDVGSGGGFPGIPLALALPARRALLVDSVAKKTRFVATVVEAVAASDRIFVATARAEDLARDASERDEWPVVTARAVAALPDLAETALPLVAVGGRLVAWKRAGTALDAELALAERPLRLLGGGIVEVRLVGVEGLEDHRLVVVAKRAPTPARFPRPPGERARRPL